MIFRMILYFSGSSPITGLTLSATGLYFFFGFFLTAIGAVVYDGVKTVYSSASVKTMGASSKVSRDGKLLGRASIESAIGECVNLVRCGTSGNDAADVLETGSSIDEKGTRA